MPVFTSSNLPGNIRTAGIKSVSIKATGDVAYYFLGNVRDGKLTVKAQTKQDSLMRPHTYGHLVEIAFTTIQTSAVEMKLLDEVSPKLLPLAIVCYLTENGRFFATTTLVAPKWKLVQGGNADDFRIIEWTWQGMVLESEIAALFTASLPTIGTPDVTDKFYTLAQSNTVANQVPNGVTKVEFCETGGSYVDFGNISDAKWSVELLADDVGGGRKKPIGKAIKVVFDCVGVQSATADIANVPLFAGQANNLKITHMDGMILTLLSTATQITADIINEGNVDKTFEIHLHAEGSFTWNGTNFVDSTGTTWDASIT